LGISHARAGDYQRAVPALESFLEQQPEDDYAPWTRELVSQLKKQPIGSRYALLIGIGKYADKRYNLRGPANDLPMMQQVLVEHLDFPSENISVLADEAATREGILTALDSLGKRTGLNDTVLIYYSGHAMEGEAPSYLAPHDVKYETEDIQNTIDAEELDQAIKRIPAANKVLVFDTHATYKFTALAAEQTDYTLLLATSPDKLAYEQPIKSSEDGTKHVGAFTYAFIQQIENSPPDPTAQEIMRGIEAKLEQIQPNQKPLLFGRKENPLFSSRAESKYYLDLFSLSQRQNYNNRTLEGLSFHYQDIERDLLVPFPQLHYRFGRAFLDKSNYQLAQMALKTALEQRNGCFPEAKVALGIAQLRTQHYSKALNTFKQAEGHYKDELREPLALMEQLQQDRKHALLVGIDVYGDSDSYTGRGAVNDVQALTDVLTKRYDFQETDIKILINQAVTKEAILADFHELVEHAKEQPALFYFAGSGGILQTAAPVIVCNSNEGGWIDYIELGELANIVGETPSNLVAIFDAGWAPGLALPWGQTEGSRFYSRRPTSVARDLGPPPELDREWDLERFHSQTSPFRQDWQRNQVWEGKRKRVTTALNAFKIGRLSIFHVSIQAASKVTSESGGEAIVEAEFPVLDGSSEKAIYGALTYALVANLRDSDPDSLTYADLIEKISARLKWLQPYVVSENLAEVVFSNHIKEGNVQALLNQQIFQAPVRQTVASLETLANRQDGMSPEDYVDLGIAYGALKDYERAISSLKNAIDERGESCAEARYYLGRLLYESGGDLDRTLSELRAAIEHNPEIGPAYYYLGQAIIDRVERESEALGEAKEALQTYLDKGDPLGKRGEVYNFLNPRETRIDSGYEPSDTQYR
jgi:tetratricopeptide (TPR) repeat protein